MEIVLLCTVCFIVSFSITSMTRAYATRMKIIDIPNERSSHTVPTPRGGGIAIVFTFLISIVLLTFYGTIHHELSYALLGGGVIIAGIGYADDIHKINAGWRILIHLAAAIWAVYWLHGFTTFNLGTWQLSLNALGYIIAIIGIVWFINLYNFMDGVDGLAGSQGLFVAVTSCLALWFLNDTSMALVLLLLATAIAGFIVLNWPPAKIFLGDSGSGFIGYVFAVLALNTNNTGALPSIFWLILLSVFICDATFTLLYRVMQGKKWHSAHREHAYQRLIFWGINHKQISLGIIFVNLGLVLPAAFAALFWPSLGFWIMASLMLGLFFMWYFIQFPKL